MKYSEEIEMGFAEACAEHGYELTSRNLVLFALGTKWLLTFIKEIGVDVNEMKLNGDGG